MEKICFMKIGDIDPDTERLVGKYPESLADGDSIIIEIHNSDCPYVMKEVSRPFLFHMPTGAVFNVLYSNELLVLTRVRLERNRQRVREFIISQMEGKPWGNTER
jgi:hypothetical protein